jgi:hypothetical protein
MSKLLESKRQDGAKGLIFYCPGCKMYHSVTIAPARNDNGASWTWNGDMDKPTFNPSVGTFMGTEQQCHLFVRNGQIQFLDDSHHDLRGKTVEMEEA